MRNSYVKTFWTLMILFASSIALSACMLTPGTGEEPPDFINNGGEGNGGTDSTAACLLDNYTQSPSGLLTMVNSFIPTVINQLEFDAGPSGPAYITVSVAIGDNPSFATGCSLVVQFYRDSDDNSGKKITVPVTAAHITALTISTGELYLPSIGLSGGRIVDASVVAYVGNCPGQGAKTSNLLQAFYADQ